MNKELNLVLRGYPVGFKMPDKTNNKKDEFFLYNHLKFQITYHEDPELFKGIRITRFDVHPVSITHELPVSDTKVSDETQLATCSGMQVDNDPNLFLSLSFRNDHGRVKVIYSYDVTWIESDELLWADRWDVYL